MDEPRTDLQAGTALPQFTTAEYHEVLPDSRALLIRGLLFGAGGALLGMILYAGVGIFTGLEIGYVSLAVGYIVGKAILFGSRGRRGRRYQVAALVLTYMSVSVSAVPIGLSQLARAPQTESAATTPASAEVAPAEVGVPADAKPIGIVAAIFFLILIGLASPILALQSPVHGLIGLVILGVGMQIAWKMTGALPAGVPEALAQPAGPGIGGDDKPTSLNIRG